MYIKEGINFRLREDLSVFHEGVLETIFVELKNSKKKESIVEGVLYRPPNSKMREFEDELEKLLSKIIKVISERSSQLRTQLTQLQKLSLKENSGFNGIRTHDLCDKVMEGEVQQELLKIDPTKSAGIDDLSTKVIRQIAPIIKKPLTSIFNKSFTTGIIPDKFKISLVTPVYKGPSTRIRIFLNPQIFLSGYGFRPHASGEFGSKSGYF